MEWGEENALVSAMLKRSDGQDRDELGIRYPVTRSTMNDADPEEFIQLHVVSQIWKTSRARNGLKISLLNLTHPSLIYFHRCLTLGEMNGMKISQQLVVIKHFLAARLLADEVLAFVARKFLHK